jgi:hypothetical protein
VPHEEHVLRRLAHGDLPPVLSLGFDAVSDQAASGTI